MHRNRTASTILVALVIAVAIAPSTDRGRREAAPLAIGASMPEQALEPVDSSSSDAPPITAPRVTYGADVDAPMVATVEWAIERYVRAGLQLPDLHITAPTTCQGRAGAYVVGEGEIRLCSSGRKLVLHEMAHAWDDHGQVDRLAFLTARGLDEWFEWAVDDKHDSGGEQLAHLIAWGLMDIDTMAREMTEPGQSIDEQRRFLTHLEDLDADEVHDLFERFTGVTAFDLESRPRG